MRALIFPGQGCQKEGMGKDLYEQFPKAKELFERANEFLGRRITDVMFYGTEQELMETILPDMQHLGFDIVSLGAGSYSINGIPADVDITSARKIIQEMLNSLQDGVEQDADEYKSRIALAMAQQTSIVSGQVLSDVEMDNLMSSLLQSSNPNLTPNGKTIIKIITDYELAKLFS